jgi:hypothetical protein
MGANCNLHGLVDIVQVFVLPQVAHVLFARQVDPRQLVERRRFSLLPTIVP